MFAAVARGRSAHRRRPGRRHSLVAGGTTPCHEPRLVDVGWPGRVPERRARCASSPQQDRRDRPLVERVAPVTPAWRPLSSPLPAGQVAVGPRTNVLAYANHHGRVAVRDVDAGLVLWRSHRYGRPIREVQWSADHMRLLVRTTFLTTQFLDARGRAISKAKQPIFGAPIAPDGRRAAFIRRATAGHSDVLVAPRHGSGPLRRVLSREGRITDPTWSPDGKWLLVTRPGANEWLFIPSLAARPGQVHRRGRLFPASSLPGAAGRTGFPQDQRLVPLRPLTLAASRPGRKIRAATRRVTRK